MVMIPDEAWKAIAQDDRFLCLACMEARLREKGLRVKARLQYTSDVIAAPDHEANVHGIRAMHDADQREETRRVRMELDCKTNKLRNALALIERLETELNAIRSVRE